MGSDTSTEHPIARAALRPRGQQQETCRDDLIEPLLRSRPRQMNGRDFNYERYGPSRKGVELPLLTRC